MVELILLLTLIINTTLFVVVLYRGLQKNRSSQLLSIVIAFIILWVLGDLLLLYGNNENQVNIGRYTWTIAPMIAALALYHFIRQFGSFKASKDERNVARFLTVLSVIWTGFYLFNPTMAISQIIISPNRNQLIINSKGFQFYTLYFTVYFLVCLIILNNKRVNSTGQQRSQLTFLLVGTALTMVGAAITNLALPAMGNVNYIWLGPVFSLTYVISFSYAILKHNLFDINKLIARSLAYALSLTTVSVVYIAISYVVTARIFGNSNSAYTGFANIVLLIVAAVTYGRVKNFFDKVTNSIFYHDAYDPQILLDQINNIVLSNINLRDLLDKTTSVINTNVKTEKSLFVISKTNSLPSRSFGQKSTTIAKDKLDGLFEKYGHNSKIVLTDSLHETTDLRKTLNKESIAVIARLVTHSETMGYLLLGDKKSGNPFSAQDLKVIDIISGEIAIAIQNSLRFEEIQNFNLTLQAKVNEATKKLRRANEKLKELDETKDDFISMASHQLRTPLTSIKGYLSMVMEGDAGKVTSMQKDMLGQAFFSSQRMVYLIADLLNVSRLKTGKFNIEPTKINLATLVGQELEQLKETAATRGLVLSYDPPEEFPDLMLDETKTRQVIMNFVDNAIYYTPSGGHIKVRLINKPSTVEFRVEDTGIGVPKVEQPHIFTKFYRAPNARKARPDGTGLGLFMAKKVIIAEGGALIFESEEGKGSIFGFTFSKAKLASKETEIAPSEALVK